MSHCAPLCDACSTTPPLSSDGCPTTAPTATPTFAAAAAAAVPLDDGTWSPSVVRKMAPPYAFLALKLSTAISRWGSCGAIGREEKMGGKGRLERQGAAGPACANLPASASASAKRYPEIARAARAPPTPESELRGQREGLQRAVQCSMRISESLTAARWALPGPAENGGDGVQSI